MSRRAMTLIAGLAAVGMLVAGCGGSGDSGGSHRSPAAALATAKKKFDRAGSVHLSLKTGSKPGGGNAVLGADGELTHAPAFKGDVEVVISGIQAKVPVVAVDHKLYAKLPLTSSYAVIDPADYGAPDPADFVDPDTGLSSLLTRMAHVKSAGRTRDGSQILTSYSGTLPGSKVKPIIPSAEADGTFETKVGIDEAGRVATVRVTGDFFSGQGDVTYDLTLDHYGDHVEISAP